MSISSKLIPVVLLSASFALVPGAARAQQPARALEEAGGDALGRLCFQCHRASMWSDLRLDRRGWEGVLYRMVGRGALWNEDEIKAMAAYLASSAGPPTGKPAK